MYPDEPLACPSRLSSEGGRETAASGRLWDDWRQRKDLLGKSFTRETRRRSALSAQDADAQRNLTAFRAVRQATGRALRAIRPSPRRSVQRSPGTRRLKANDAGWVLQKTHRPKHYRTRGALQ